MAAAKRQGSVFDNLATVLSLLGISIPIFFLGLLLVLRLRGLAALAADRRPGGPPAATTSAARGRTFYLWESLVIDHDIPKFLDVVKHLILPALALGTIPLAYVARITRSAVLEVLNEDYVRTARAKGLPTERIDRRHVLRNAMLPISRSSASRPGCCSAAPS